MTQLRDFAADDYAAEIGGDLVRLIETQIGSILGIDDDDRLALRIKIARQIVEHAAASFNPEQKETVL